VAEKSGEKRGLGTTERVELEEVKPWPEPVDSKALLDELAPNGRAFCGAAEVGAGGGRALSSLDQLRSAGEFTKKASGN
jgi:hypothetical protein